MRDFVSSLLFEHLWRLLILLILVQFVLIALWSWRRTTATRRAVWIGFVAAAVLPAMSHLIVTPREQIVRLCHEMARYVDEGNVPALIMRLSDDAVVGSLDRDAFADRLIEMLEAHPIDHPRLSAVDVTFSDPTHAVGVFNTACFVRNRRGVADRVYARWRVWFRREGDGWRVTRVKPLPSSRTPRSWFRDGFELIR